MNNNMLIIGGLALLVIVALIGIILLGIDEERREKQPKVASAAFPVQPVEAVIPPAPELGAPTARASATLPAPQIKAPSSSVAPGSPPAQAVAMPPVVTHTSQVASTDTLSMAASSTVTPEMSSSVLDRDHHASRHLPPSLHKSGPFVPFDDNHSSMLVAHTEEATAAILREEIHAISGEVRLLIQKASEMEQRLHTLSDALARQQDTQNGMAARSPMPEGEAREER